MSLEASCPRCASFVKESDGAYACSVHGAIEPLWRPTEVGYEAFADLVGRVEDLPTFLPWPMSPGWMISDFGCVASPERARATVTTTAGTSDLDGPVEVTIVVEEPGVGLGSRCAGTAYDDPGAQVGNGPPLVRVRAAGRSVPLWHVDARDDDDLLARSVFAGEAEGRWLWLVIRPASAALLLRDEWLLADVTGFGPEALEMPFGGPRPLW